MLLTHTRDCVIDFLSIVRFLSRFILARTRDDRVIIVLFSRYRRVSYAAGSASRFLPVRIFSSVYSKRCAPQEHFSRLFRCHVPRTSRPAAASSFLIIGETDKDERGPTNEDGDTRLHLSVAKARCKSEGERLHRPRDSGLMSFASRMFLRTRALQTGACKAKSINSILYTYIEICIRYIQKRQYFIATTIFYQNVSHLVL